MYTHRNQPAQNLQVQKSTQNSTTANSHSYTNYPKLTMSSFTHATTLLNAHIKTKQQRNTSNNNNNNNNNPLPPLKNQPPLSPQPTRRNLISTFLATSTTLGVGVLSCTTNTPLALAQNWGTRSFMKEHFFMPGLSPEDAVARIKQTAEGLHNMREMLETMSWRYVLFYIRLKQNYLEQDLKNVLSTMPENRRGEYVKTANELVDNMTELDRYVRSPKVYESYLYYEKTLKSLDELVAMLA